MRAGMKEAAAVLEGHKAGIAACSMSSDPFYEPLAVTAGWDTELRVGSHSARVPVAELMVPLDTGCRAGQVWEGRKMRSREVLQGHYDSIVDCSVRCSFDCHHLSVPVQAA